jgi:predicted RNase H-like HicB family nuclease
LPQQLFHVEATWDPEADVWVATSEDVPGLATEAPSLERLREKLRTIVPELLEANRVIPTQDMEGVSFELTSHRQERVRLAS